MSLQCNIIQTTITGSKVNSQKYFPECMGWAKKTGPFFEVYNSCSWWHRKAFYIL